MKRMKWIEDLNICIIDAQGIVGVGATIRMLTVSCRAVALLPTDDGLDASRTSSSPSGFCRDCIGACS
jgi:hypothetical protein